MRQTNTFAFALKCIAIAVAISSHAAARDPLPADQRDAKSQPALKTVGPSEGGVIVPTGQLVRPAGETLAFGGRPLDLALSNDRRTLYVKTVKGLMMIDARAWRIERELPFPTGEAGSMHGIAVAPNGKAVFVTGAHRALLEATPDDTGAWRWQKRIALGPHDVNPCGVCISRDGNTAYVALSISNTLAVVDLAGERSADEGTSPAKAVVKKQQSEIVNAKASLLEIPVGVCPFGVVLSSDDGTAYVSNFGGRHAKPGEHAEKSDGTPVVVDDRSIAASGTVTRIDLKTNKSSGELAVGLHPCDLKLSADGRRLFVANANSDSVSIVDTAKFAVAETISVRPDPRLPFGSITNAVCLSGDEQTLFAANGGNNAVAVVDVAPSPKSDQAVRGFIPTGWFPGAVATDGESLFIANVKGEGSRQADRGAIQRNSGQMRGSITRVPIPDEKQLAQYTAQAKADARAPQMLRAQEAARSGVQPVPIPARVGEPSSIEHVVYVIKENRTYDQIFGDLPKGNNSPHLCTFGRKVTPNQHALAEEFVQLDNYYCNGVLSADGHQWATQGAVTDYQEKAFGDHVRSYMFGSDPLTYAGCNFIWDSVLLHGRSFRNYGEFDFPSVVPGNSTWFDVYHDFQAKAGRIKFQPRVDLKTLRKYTCPEYPGWNLMIPDVVRIAAYLKELREAEKSGDWPNFMIVYLPQDHTAGTNPDRPTPRAFVADNDLAVGKLVDAISHSRFWASTAIFVNEDDPQDGWDHVDGHRSLCLVVSPFARRHALVSQFYNQLSVLHTMERILGLPSDAQLTSQAPTLEDCFTTEANLAPYTVYPNEIPLDEPNKKLADQTDEERRLTLAGMAMDLTRPDRINDDIFNRILWHSVHGITTPYPAALAGPHGKGFAALHLKPQPVDHDDDD